MEKRGFAMKETNAPEVAEKGHFNLLHILLTIGLIGGFVATYFICVGTSGGLLDTVLWFFAVMLPYVALFILCVVRKGLPGFLHNKTGGIVMLVFLAVMLLLTPKLFGWLFWATIAFFFLGGAKVVGGATSAVTVTRKDANGQTVTETRRYLGDADVAAALAAKELESEGYRNVKIEKE